MLVSPEPMALAPQTDLPDGQLGVQTGVLGQSELRWQAAGGNPQ